MRSKKPFRIVAAPLLGAVAMGVAIGMTAAPALAGHGGSATDELNVVGQFEVNVDGLTTDVWAYGNYAYIGSFNQPLCSLDLTGVRIIDIADPTDPKQVGFIPAQPGTRNNDVKVAHIDTRFFDGEILVATNEPCNAPFLPRLHAQGAGFIPGQGGIAIWDVTNPAKPRPLRQNFLGNGIHNTFIWQDGDNAYLIAVDDIAALDVIIVDITKPRSPKVIARTGAPDWGELSVNIDNGAVFLHDVWVEENDLGEMVAYLSYWDAGLVMLDVTDPRIPVFMGDSDYIHSDPLSGVTPAGDSHVAVPNAGGTRVLMGDEDFAAGTLPVFDFETIAYPALEGGFTVPVYLLPGAAFSGPVVWTGGLGCTAADIPPAGTADDVALIQRGVCFFQDKAEAADAQGYAGFIVANDAARGDALVTMAPRDGGPYPEIPGFFVGYSTGETMKGVPNGMLETEGIFDGYGYLRLLDVSDPTSIVELDQFATEGVFVNPPLGGDRTMHNVVVDGGTLAYISWYAEGLRVVDFAGDTLNEVAHFVDTVNGSNFWGVYLHDHPDGNTYVLGSGRDSGLWIFDVP